MPKTSLLFLVTAPSPLSVWSILPPSKDMKEVRTPVHAEFQLGVSVCVSQQQSLKVL